MNTQGHIKLFIGPMFASKSSRMVDEVEKHYIANNSCIIVNHSSDIRYNHLSKSGGIVTHSGREHARVPTIAAHKLRDIYDEITQYDVIGIDETQFFEDCVEVIHELACAGKKVICAALDADFRARPFGRIHELIPRAETVVKLKAVCMNCNAEASFTKKLIADDTVVEVGGIDKYVAVCRRCMWD